MDAKAMGWVSPGAGGPELAWWVLGWWVGVVRGSGLGLGS